MNTTPLPPTWDQIRVYMLGHGWLLSAGKGAALEQWKKDGVYVYVGFVAGENPIDRRHGVVRSLAIQSGTTPEETAARILEGR